jgi:hypothetical protein
MSFSGETEPDVEVQICRIGMRPKPVFGLSKVYPDFWFYRNFFCLHWATHSCLPSILYNNWIIIIRPDLNNMWFLLHAHAPSIVIFCSMVMVLHLFHWQLWHAPILYQELPSWVGEVRPSEGPCVCLGQGTVMQKLVVCYAHHPSWTGVLLDCSTCTV